MEKIKIIVIKNNYEWIKTMVCLLNNEENFIIVGTAFDVQEAIRLVNSVSVDVVLFGVDIFDDKDNEFKTVFEIIRTKDIKVLLINTLNLKEFSQVFLTEKINYSPWKKNTDMPAIIRAVVNNNPSSILKDYYRLKKMEKLASLTLAEKEVFYLLEQRNTISQIACKLNKSEGTIKSQINKILKKLDAKSSKEAVRKLAQFNFRTLS